MGEVSIQEAMQQFLNKSRLRTGIQSVQIESVWEKLMGKTVAKYTDKIHISGSTLFIHSSVAPLKNELMYQKESIISRVNEALGSKQIKDVVIR